MTPTNSATDAVVEEVVTTLYAANWPDDLKQFEPPEIQEMFKCEAKAAISAFLRAARQQGYVMVPVEPTKQMILDAETAIEDFKDEDYDSGRDDASSHSYEYFRPGVELAVHKAMLQAAPRCPWESDG